MILIALLVVGGLVGVALVPAFLVPTMQRTLDAMVATMAQDPNVDIQSFRSTMDAIVTASLALGGVVGVVAVVIIITGIVRLWRWVYWYLAVSFLLAPLGVLENAALYAMGSGPISIPGWLLLYSVPVALVETALSVWMIVLYRRHGTWARRRLPA